MTFFSFGFNDSEFEDLDDLYSDFDEYEYEEEEELEEQEDDEEEDDEISRYCEILGVHKNASKAEIKKRFKNLKKRKVSPDKFLKIKRAYQYLINQENSFDSHADGYSNTHDSSRKIIENQKNKNNCNSHQKSAEMKKIQCRFCNGTGYFSKNSKIKNGNKVVKVPKCIKCKGNGFFLKKILKNRNIEPLISKKNKHQASKDEHPFEDKRFQRKGRNLFMKHDITLYEALLGFSFVIKLPNSQSILIKSNDNNIIKPGMMKSVKNCIPKSLNNSNRKGDLIIQFNVIFPDSINNTNLTNNQNEEKTIKEVNTENQEIIEEVYRLEDFNENEVNSNYRGGKNENKEDDQEEYSFDDDGEEIGCHNQ